MAGIDRDEIALINAADFVESLPPMFAGAVDPTDLEDIWLMPIEPISDGDTVKYSTGILFDRALSLSIPGLDAVKLVIGNVAGATEEEDDTVFEFEVEISPDLKLTLKDVSVALRLHGDFFKPARLNHETNAYEVDPTHPFVDIKLGTISLSIDADAGVQLTTNGGIDLPLTMIGDSGVVVTANDIQLFLTGSGLQGKKGISIPSAQVFLPGTLGRSVTLSMTNAFIGNGGFSGTVGANVSPPVDESFGGLTVALDAIAVKFVQNALIDATLTGTMLVPYFDKRVQAALTLGLDGHIALAVTGVAPGQGQFDTTTGIVTLSAGPLTFNLTRLGVELLDGKGIFHAAGKVTPDVSGLTFPSFDVQDLSVDTDGHVKVAGGWIDLPNQVSLDLYGFTLEITKLGFGSLDDGRNWVGFSGGLKLVDGLSAGASVDGLRVIWKPGETPTVALDGVGIKLDIPNTLLLEGEVSLKDKDFRGAVKLALPSLNFEFDGQFVAGTVPGTTNQKYFAIFVHTELPAGLPLGSTGLAIYGGAGLFAHNMVPGKQKTEGWYQNPDLTPGWYLRGKPGVDDLQKWSPTSGGMGFGAGVTIGTFPDNGFNFSGRLLLVVAFPGPVIILEGKANLFKKRSELATGEPMFRALAILDAGKSFQMNLDAKFKYKADGKLLDMAGSAEAFFDFNKGDNWHIWLGVKDDKKRRIRARAFKLFTVDAYFQLNPRQLDVGSGWSFDKRYGFSHLEVRVAASFEEGGSISWHPAHFAGFWSMQGRAELRAFGRGVGLNAKATVNGEVFEPMALKGDFHVGIDLPWPLPDVGGTITLEWKEQMNNPPRLPLPLQEASAEIPARSLRWPFKRGTNVLPNNDQAEAEFASPPGTGTGAPVPTTFDFNQALKIPVDAQLGLSFGRPVHDPANVGQYQTPVVPADVVGDPVKQDITQGAQTVTTGYTVGYTLTSVLLEKLAPVAPAETQGSPLPSPLPPGAGRIGWVTVAQKGAGGPTTATELFGAWTPALPPAMPVNQQNASGTTHAQTKLMLNAKSPFEYTARASRAWDEWFTEASPAYPCSPANPNERFVAVFEQPIGTQLPQAPGHFQFTNPAFDVQWFYGGDIGQNEEVVEGVLGPIDRGLRMLPLPRPSGIVSTEPERIVPPPGVDEVDIRIGTPETLKPFFQHGVFVAGVDPQLVLDRTVLVSTFKYTAGGQRDPNVPPPVSIQSGNGEGLSIPFSVSLVPKEPAIAIELGLFADTENPDLVGRIELFDSTGAPLLATPEPINRGRTTVRLEAADIAEIVLTSDPGTFPLLEKIYVRTPIMAIASSSAGIVGTFHEEDGVIRVVGPNLGTIILGASCGGQFLVLELSIPSRRDEVIRHTVESLARFNEKGPVFEPDTNYRLTLKTQRDSTPKGSNTGPVNAKTAITEQVYFRTAALPGIGVPALPAGTVTENPSVPALTGFEDLTFYVKRTVPAAPPPAGGHQTPARAVYRAYDQKVEYSTDTPYVELMYLLGRRDLSLRLFDANSNPIRDARGSVIVAGTQWDQSHDPTISASAARWIGMVNAAACVTSPDFDPRSVVRSEVVSAPSEDVVLPPEVLHQARLVPMLLHEAFVSARLTLVANGQGAQLDRWRAEQAGATASSWKAHKETVTPPGQTTSVTVFYVSEDSGTASALVYDGPLASLQDTAHRDHPRNWSEVRASVQLRWQAGEVGFEVRRSSANDLIRVVLNRDTGARQLIAISGGVSSVLAEDTTTFPGVDSDVIVTVECEDDHVRVFQQLVGEPSSAPIFDVTGAPTVAGPVALFSNGATAPRFTEIDVHDLRPDPSTAFRFDFITSKFTNFHHHLHSFDDQILPIDTAAAGVTSTDLTAVAGAAIDVPGTSTSPGLGPVLDAEARAFDRLEEAALGDDKLRTLDRVEIVKASRSPDPPVFMIRSPEPLQWERTQLAVAALTPPLDLGVPGDLKITSVAFGGTPAGESVTVQVRNRAGLADATIEWRPLPDATTPDPAWTRYYTFGNEPEIADGTVVQVFSGDVTQAPARPAGTTQRFGAPDPDSAEVHFPATGVELRVRGGTRTVIHQRQFVPPPSYATVGMRAIRKLDGTALFLFPAPGVTLPTPPATVRFSLTLRRDVGDNPAVLPVLSQAGSTDPEVAVLDLKVD